MDPTKSTLGLIKISINFIILNRSLRAASAAKAAKADLQAQITLIQVRRKELTEKVTLAMFSIALSIYRSFYQRTQPRMTESQI